MNASAISFWRHHKRFLLWLYAASLALRLCFFMLFVRHGDNAWICFDSAQYHNLALQIAAGNGITNPTDGQPQTYRLPGYPLFLAGCYKVFSYLASGSCVDDNMCKRENECLDPGLRRGDKKLNVTHQKTLPNSTEIPSSRRRPGSRLDIILTLLFQLIIASLLPLLIFIISLLLFPGKTSLAGLSGIVAAVHPGFILYAGMLATEPLFTLFLCVFFILLARGIQPQKHSAQTLHFLYAGINLGIASLIRPVGHYVILVTIACMLIALRPFLTTLRNVGLLLCGWLCVVTPWLLRNFLLTGALFFHTLPGLHFLQYTAVPILVEQEGCSYLVARSRLLEMWNKNIAYKETELNCHLNDYERCRMAEHQTFEIVAQNKFLTLKNACLQILKTCCGLYSAQVLIADTGKWPEYRSTTSLQQKIYRFIYPELNHRWLIIFVYWDITLLLFFLLGMIGYCVRLIYISRVDFLQGYSLILIALIIGLTLAYGCARLRFPAELFIIPLACNFYIWLTAL